MKKAGMLKRRSGVHRKNTPMRLEAGYSRKQM